jgi:putative SOS response-associated peptidase YedK
VRDRRPGRALLFAGLWARWRDRSADRHVETFTVLTRPAAGTLAEIHDRMPVCLEPEQARAWVDPARDDRDELAGWLAALPPAELALRPVSRAVNRVGNEGPELLEERPDHA